MMMFVQPFGLESSGGGAKILRSLVKGRTAFVSINTSPNPAPPTDLGREIHVPARSSLGRIDSSRLGPYGDWLSRKIHRRSFRKRLADIVEKEKPTGVHAIAHSTDFFDAFVLAKKKGIPITVTIHDDPSYVMCRSPCLREVERNLGIAWRDSDRRIVICERMGQEYIKRFGVRDFDVITDSLEPKTVAHRRTAKGRLNIYFMGSIHLTYAKNFEALSLGVASFAEKFADTRVTLVSRGGVPPATKHGFPFEFRSWGSETDVESDMETADFLYLPIPFDREFESFAKYSLPTKLVTYLGSGIPVLYHGPAYSSTSDLLSEYHAGYQIHTNEPEEVASRLSSFSNMDHQIITQSALRLVHERFQHDQVVNRFWNHSSYSRENQEAIKVS